MTQNQIIVGVVVLIILIGGGIYLMNTGDGDTSTPQETEQTETDDTEGDAVRIDAKHFFIDGTHTVVGEMVMPTPCDLLTVEADVAESDPEQVTLRFEVVNNSEDGACAQVLTPQRFKVSFDAREDAVINATYGGNPVVLNLIAAQEGETPDDFEVFIKG